ncbi:hypothetical protein HDK77DRAFT_444931 [Phyllosticta capitalensis]
MVDEPMSDLRIHTDGTMIHQNSNNRGVIAANMHHATLIGTQTHNYYGQSGTAQDESFHRWISPLDFSGSHEQIRDEFAPGTAQWILDLEVFTSWKSKKTRNLWCVGKPGAGKTFLAFSVIEHLKKQEDFQVAFVYLSYHKTQGETPSVRDLLGCLVNQLIDRMDGASPRLPRLQNLMRIHKTTSPLGVLQLKDLLSELASPSTFIVVDALDEFDPQQCQTLLDHLRQTKINLLVTSRNQPRREFQVIEVEAKEHDVHSYIQHKCDEDGRLLDLTERDKDLIEEIKFQITKNAAGLFLLVRFHVSAVLEAFCATDLRQMLKKLPSSHDSIYESTWNRITAQNPTSSDCAIRTIGWILHVNRPLEVQELRHALLIQEMQESKGKQSHMFFDHGRLFQENDILAFCHGLVQIDKGNTVGFVHSTTREYFDKTKRDYFLGFQCRIALACAAYICIPRIGQSQILGHAEQFCHDLTSHREELKEYGYLEKYYYSRRAAAIARARKLSLHDTDPVWRRRGAWEIFRLDSEWTSQRYFNGSGVVKKLSRPLIYWLYPFVQYAEDHFPLHFKAVDENARAIVENQIRILLEDHHPNRLPYSKPRSRDPGCLEELEIAACHDLPHVMAVILSLGGRFPIEDCSFHRSLLYAAKNRRHQLVSRMIMIIQETREERNEEDMMIKRPKRAGRVDLNQLRPTSRYRLPVGPPSLEPDLLHYIKLLSASEKGEAAEISHLARLRFVDLNVDVSVHIHDHQDWDVTRKRFVITSFYLCRAFNHLEAQKVFIKSGTRGLGRTANHFEKYCQIVPRERKGRKFILWEKIRAALFD